jgi:hypothetical protein
MMNSIGATVGHENATLLAFYLSRDRVLSLIGSQEVPLRVVAALQGEDVAMASAILSNAVGTYVLKAVKEGSIRTLQQHFYEGTLKPGVPFIYDGHFYGKGFAASNKTPSLSLAEKLDEPLPGMRLVFDFSKNGLVNDTAYTRMSGSTRLFAFGYITDIDNATIRAVPYAIGDLVENCGPLPMAFAEGIELHPNDVDQFADLDSAWLPRGKEFERLTTFPERQIKQLICDLLGEHDTPKDWGGEESDVFTANLMVGGVRRTAAFLLKGPAAFHQMRLSDCGKNDDQIYRLFNIPAQIFIVQHCHYIGPAVRKTVEAFALHRALSSPCHYLFVDGVTTARLLRANGLWEATPRKQAKKTKGA